MAANSTKLRVLVVDDEPLARQRLEDLLSQQEDIELIGLVDNGREAVRRIREDAPDLVFLDVQMPGLTGVEVVREVGPEHMPVTIFVTAYDQYAVKAFEVAAVDYLLKPFDDERFEQAFSRARKMVNLHAVDAVTGRLRALLNGNEDAEGAARAPAEARSAPPYLERIAVEMRNQVRVVSVDNIDFITASGPYAELHIGEDTFIIRERMMTLDDRLDPNQFFRIHRSAIVRLDMIDSLIISAGGDYAVRLKTGMRLKVSRSRKEELEQRLGLVL